MNEWWEFEKSDIEFLQDVAKMELSMAAQKWIEQMGWKPEKAEANARAWLHRIRRRVTRCRNYVNKILALQKQSPRIRKLTTSGQLENEEDEQE
ncbi:MAG: hypothetical protein MUP17_09375 [candidate division Zixibacteria bacterium]|nr:hypothetical protein [candidate division Zixibacteria bacterium]